MTKVRDILKVLPAGTQVVAGANALDRDVSWASRPKPGPPVFGHLRGGEIVLFSGATLNGLEEPMSLEEAVHELARSGVSAIAYLGRVSAGAKSAAEEQNIVFMQLPSTADLSLLEQDAFHHITERRREIQRRGQEAGRRLLELAIAGETLPVIIRSLAESAGHSVALEGRDGRLHSFHAPDEHAMSRAESEAVLASAREALIGPLRMMAESSPAEPPVAVYPLGSEWSRVVAPVIGKEGLLGSISMIARTHEISDEERTLTSRGAAACAIVMVREYATLAARREIEVNVLDEVLDGALRSELTLLQQAKRLGHDLALPHIALVVRLDAPGSNAIARPREQRWPVLDEVMARRGPRLLWRIRNNSAEIIWPVADANEAKAVATTLEEDLRRRLHGSTLVPSIGAGRVRSGLAGIQQSHQEAKQALSLGRRLGAGGLTRFDDLGLYRLVFAAEKMPELRDFHDETLRPLISYDQEHGADLIRTLKAFFDARCGPKEAAGLLGVHRNTVLYRLERVKEISALDLDDPDVRLRLHLALCVHLALYAADNVL